MATLLEDNASKLGQDVPGVNVGITCNVCFEVLPMHWNVLFWLGIGLRVVFSGNNDSEGAQFGIWSNSSSIIVGFLWLMLLLLFVVLQTMLIICGHYMIARWISLSIIIHFM